MNSMNKTFAQKIFESKIGRPVEVGEIVFAEPDLILSHDNTASIEKTFKKMGGKKVKYPERLVIFLDHNAPPTTAELSNDYQAIRNFVARENISKFHNVGDGICHQLMSNYVFPGALVVGSDSHTPTSGAFNAFSAGIDRTEVAGLWLTGKTWFRVPESIKITLRGKLPKGVYSKDIALWVIGLLGADGANYASVEYHGDGIETLSIADRMTIANLGAEMGAKTAVFPKDDRLDKFFNGKYQGIWADSDAKYIKELIIDLDELFPVVACPHNVDNVKSVSDVKGTKIHQALIGTCTNGRLEDIHESAEILKGKKIHKDVQLLVIPASKEIYISAMKDGSLAILLEAGANVLSPSCGPCLGTGQGIPADGWNVISTANRNFLGRMGNPKANIYLASPATVSASAIAGEIVDPREVLGEKVAHKSFSVIREEQAVVQIKEGDDRYSNGVWNYSDVNNLNTDQMFAGNLTYSIKSSEGDKIVPHLFKGLDATFGSRVKAGDIIIAGENFGCGSSREHPSVGLAFAGVQAVIAKSVSRIFYRSSVNQGLPVIVLPEAVDFYKQGDRVQIDFEMSKITIGAEEFSFPRLPAELIGIFKAKGLVNYYSQQQ